MRASRLGLVLSGAILVALLSGCATSPDLLAPSSPGASREASILASRLCIINATDYVFPLVRERGPFKTGDHHPDPEGPLAPGGQWCTNGYNSWDGEGLYLDATAEILFTEDGSQQVYLGVYNSWIDPPRIVFGKNPRGFGAYQAASFEGWETSILYPEIAPKTYRKHDYLIQRLNDSEFFKEWRVTVRS